MSLYRLHEEAAALHLFRVAAGLDSLVPGEGEILGQVRAAYEAGRARPAARPGLPAGARTSASASARETAIGESPASVSSAAAALAAQVFGDLTGRRVLLIGAGRIGELAASNLALARRRIAFVANRTPDTARSSPRASAAQALALERDRRAARRGRRRRLVDERARARVARGRRARAPPHPLFFIDIAVPRDLDPAIAELDGCFLYDIDDLEAVVAETLAGRRAEAARAEQLVAEEAERFRSWRASLDVVPAIASLRARAEEIRTAELAQGRAAAVSDDERRTLESVTAQILEQAAAPADRPHEGGGGQCRRRGLRRRGAASVRSRGGALNAADRRIERPLPLRSRRRRSCASGSAIRPAAAASGWEVALCSFASGLAALGSR